MRKKLFGLRLIVIFTVLASVGVLTASAAAYTASSPVMVSAATSPFANCTADGGQVGTFYPNTEVEPWVEVNPANPRNIVATWQQDRWNNGGSRGLVAGVTTNGGRRWQQVVVPNRSACSGNPALQAGFRSLADAQDAQAMRESSPMPRKPPPAPIPQSRLERLARIGMAAGELAGGAAAEGIRRLARGEAAEFGAALLSAPNARRLAARLARLRGAAMKIGQLVSLQGEDVLPPEFAQALAVLRSQASPMPPEQVRRALGREYGKGWEKRFARFDWEPVAAASIGQVHRATAADGRDLALKIQYPGVARCFWP